MDRGYVLTELVLKQGSPAANRALKDLKLKQNAVQVLAVERDGTFMPVPDGSRVLSPGDSLIVYGLEHAVARIFDPCAHRTALLNTPAAEDSTRLAGSVI